MERGAFQNPEFVAASKKMTMVKTTPRGDGAAFRKFEGQGTPSIYICDADGKLLETVNNWSAEGFIEAMTRLTNPPEPAAPADAPPAGDAPENAGDPPADGEEQK